MHRSRKTGTPTLNSKKVGPIQMNPRLFYGALAALGTVALIFVGILLFRDVTTVSQPPPSDQQTLPTFSTPPSAVAYSDEAEALFPSLNCLCGTCNDTLAECNCGQARSMKGYVDSLVESGISKSKVMDKVVEKYGPEALVSTE
jgi:cytochrome c-type biogenesis protein CcmH/NrfF